MKKFIAGLIVGSLLMIMSSAFAEEGLLQSIEVRFNQVKLQINGTPVEADTMLYNGTTYVPIRKVMDIMGRDMIWDADTFTANIVEKGSVLSYDPSEQVEFKDPVLEKEIRRSINKPTGALYKADVANLHGIYTQDLQAIETLDGIEQLINLKGLHISRTTINDFSAIAKIQSLETLALNSTNIEDIGFISSLTSLKMLSLSSNNISNIEPLSKLTHLEYLNIEDNHVSDLSAISSLINLTDLYIGKNPITSVAPLKNIKNLENRASGGTSLLFHKGKKYYQLNIDLILAKLDDDELFDYFPYPYGEVYIDEDDRIYSSSTNLLFAVNSLLNGDYQVFESRNPYLTGTISADFSKYVSLQQQYLNARESYMAGELYNNTLDKSYSFSLQPGNEKGVKVINRFLLSDYVLYPISNILDGFDIQLNYEIDFENRAFVIIHSP